ncbi:MAG TPA: hypothetical protein ENI87_11810 [bacterium]|nr:hypothetical protein [bacterium]
MERVFVVDREAFFGGDWPQGCVRLDDTDAFLAAARAHGRFVPRDQAEQTPAWKQWIPYCMLRCGDWSDAADDGAPDRGLFLVQRTKKQREARLHESWSIGLGGHIEPMDDGPGGPAPPEGAGAFFIRALWRELTEELRLPTTGVDSAPLPPPRLVGLINDDSTPVGKVHAGLAYCLDVPWPLPRARETVGIREISKMRGGFTSLVEFAKLWQTPSRFESWSQFLIQAEVVGAKGG